MPTYAYTCTACGHSFDIHQSFADDALTVCPECSGRLRKIFSTVGVTFKGSGFYRTDSRSGSSSSVSSTPSKPAASQPAASTPAASKASGAA
ncbi:FmdB family zinc ribbon protein [Sanguibacter sp. HDW7]|uniref:FmdB family zinc ribbon protein n=1 Tax=Sanguibacter sp. HDW7 TaxID=2714931 RepID=UPI00140C8860|nr:FmdB family zinc ribbon protein [Sanguibacter sp. HDW7]QIK84251.1 FmdB family transcriptional regulator [Sanguibacter sp. HDW7]